MLYRFNVPAYHTHTHTRELAHAYAISDIYTRLILKDTAFSAGKQFVVLL